LFVLFCSIFDPIFAEDTGVIEEEAVSIRFTGSLHSAAEKLAEVYPRLKAELETTLQWKLDLRPTIFLTKDSRAFQKIIGNDVIVAYAIPRRNLIVIDYSKMKIPRGGSTVGKRRHSRDTHRWKAIRAQRSNSFGETHTNQIPG